MSRRWQIYLLRPCYPLEVGREEANSLSSDSCIYWKPFLISSWGSLLSCSLTAKQTHPIFWRHNRAGTFQKGSPGAVSAN